MQRGCADTSVLLDLAPQEKVGSPLPLTLDIFEPENHDVESNCGSNDGDETDGEYGGEFYTTLRRHGLEVEKKQYRKCPYRNISSKVVSSIEKPEGSWIVALRCTNAVQSTFEDFERPRVGHREASEDACKDHRCATKQNNGK